MNAAELLEGLQERGATVTANGEKLKLAAPPGVLKPRVLDMVARHKVELLQLLDLERREYSEPPAVPPADGLQRRGGFIMPTRATMPAYRAHFEATAASTPQPDSDRQTERIRRLAATVSPEELLAAYKRIKPTLKKSLNQTDLHELALTLAHADKQAESNTDRPAREVHARDLYKPDESAKELR